MSAQPTTQCLDLLEAMLHDGRALPLYAERLQQIDEAIDEGNPCHSFASPGMLRQGQVGTWAVTCLES